VTDAFLAEAPDARLSWVSIAVAMNLHSVHGLSRAEICRQMGVPESALKRSHPVENKFNLGSRDHTALRRRQLDFGHLC